MPVSASNSLRSKGKLETTSSSSPAARTSTTCATGCCWRAVGRDPARERERALETFTRFFATLVSTAYAADEDPRTSRGHHPRCPCETPSCTTLPPRYRLLRQKDKKPKPKDTPTTTVTACTEHRQFAQADGEKLDKRVRHPRTCRALMWKPSKQDDRQRGTKERATSHRISSRHNTKTMVSKRCYHIVVSKPHFFTSGFLFWNRLSRRILRACAWFLQGCVLPCGTSTHHEWICLHSAPFLD